MSHLAKDGDVIKTNRGTNTYEASTIYQPQYGVSYWCLTEPDEAKRHKRAFSV